MAKVFPLLLHNSVSWLPSIQATPSVAPRQRYWCRILRSRIGSVLLWKVTELLQQSLPLCHGVTYNAMPSQQRCQHIFFHHIACTTLATSTTKRCSCNFDTSKASFAASPAQCQHCSSCSTASVHNSLSAAQFRYSSFLECIKVCSAAFGGIFCAEITRAAPLFLWQREFYMSATGNYHFNHSTGNMNYLNPTSATALRSLFIN